MTELTDFRHAKDEYFRTSPDSPLEPGQRANFAGLTYYPENPALVFEVTPELFEEQEFISMQTSTGESANYLRWARVSFEADGRQAALTVFRNPGTGEMFLPFQDSGRGVETYGAGRYLDVHDLDGGKLSLDFNYAYNPYCAYNDAWSCPLPPPENRLNVHIHAGEKVFREE